MELSLSSNSSAKLFWDIQLTIIFLDSELNDSQLLLKSSGSMDSWDEVEELDGDAVVAFVFFA